MNIIKNVIGVSLEEAKRLQKENNKSSFYKQPNETDEEYKKRQSRSKEYYINKYGNTEGINRWVSYCNKISIANKKETLIQKYGKEYADNVSDKKRQNLNNFIKRYGQDIGKIKYENFLRKTTKLRFIFIE